MGKGQELQVAFLLEEDSSFWREGNSESAPWLWNSVCFGWIVGNATWIQRVQSSGESLGRARPLRWWMGWGRCDPECLQANQAEALGLVQGSKHLEQTWELSRLGWTGECWKKWKGCPLSWEAWALVPVEPRTTKLWAMRHSTTSSVGVLLSWMRARQAGRKKLPRPKTCVQGLKSSPTRPWKTKALNWRIGCRRSWRR